MKNIYLKQTIQKTGLHKDKDGILNIDGIGENQNIYITNDEKINEGFYGINYANGRKGKGSGHYVFKQDGTNINIVNALCSDSKKIILTTNQDLIADGVQVIDYGFLKWFVENPTCEYVEVKEKQHFEKDKSKRKNPLNGIYYSYTIIIPKQNKISIEEIEKQIAITESRGDKIVQYLKKYEGKSIYNEIALAIEFGYQIRLEEE